MIQQRLDVNTLHRDNETRELGCNEIAQVELRAMVILLCKPYSQNWTRGSSIVIDEEACVPLGALMIKSGC